MMRKASTIITGFLFCAVLAWSALALAQDDPRITYRQTLMKAIGANMKAVATIYRGRLENHKDIVAHGKQLQIAAGLVEAAFKENLQSESSQSKAEVWSEWSKFVEIVKEFETASEKMASVEKTDDLKEVGLAVKAVGKTCSSCHQLYRVKKN